MRGSWSSTLVVILAAGCAASGPASPGEGTPGTPCGEIIPGCDARRLENVVLRNGAIDGVLTSVDGFDTGDVLGFDEALERSWRDGYRGGGRTVQVVLGAADADRLQWGSGGNLYYAVRFEGSCPFKDGGPPGYDPPPNADRCDATTSTILDAHTGEVILTGQEDPP